MSPIALSSTGAGAASGASAGSAATAATSADQTKNMFMQLLVAQLQNQDPMSPADGTQFVAQLAQFQQLEQSINTGQDVTDIRTQLDALVAAQSGASQTTTA